MELGESKSRWGSVKVVVLGGLGIVLGDRVFPAIGDWLWASTGDVRRFLGATIEVPIPVWLLMLLLLLAVSTVAVLSVVLGSEWIERLSRSAPDEEIGEEAPESVESVAVYQDEDPPPDETEFGEEESPNYSEILGENALGILKILADSDGEGITHQLICESMPVSRIQTDLALEALEGKALVRHHPDFWGMDQIYNLTSAGKQLVVQLGYA